MPATVTHAYFAEDVYDILPLSIKESVDLPRMKMFGQSTDPLMFYNLFNIKRGKSIRELQHLFHTSQTGEYFFNLINFIKDNNYINDKDTCSFLCGFICHYALDFTLHPFIVYKTGYFKKKNKNTYKYNNVHAFMETFIDNDMIKRRENINPYNFNIAKYVFDIRPFSSELNKVINYSFNKTYQVKNMDKIYYAALKDMKFAISLFRQDKNGVKKFCYKFVDTFMPKGVFRFEAISYHYSLDDKHNFLNCEHKIWRNPCNYQLTSHESFIDLYLKAIKVAKLLIDGTFDYIKDAKTIKLEDYFDNRSYLTGLNCDKKRELKYFEF